MKLIFQVGGPDQTFKHPIGLRFSFCLVGDLCQVSSDPLKLQSKHLKVRSLFTTTAGVNIVQCHIFPAIAGVKMNLVGGSTMH